LVVVPLKRIALIIAAIILAAIISEFVVVGLIGYPRLVFGTKVYALQPGLKPYTSLKWHAPHYALWSVEGGNKVIQYNNLGLSGPNIGRGDSTRYCMLLGNSYIEALQFEGSKTASGVLQSHLATKGSDMQVVNLGASAHDPYILWFRMKFFENYLKPTRVVLVYERFDTMTRYFSRWKTPLDFSIQKHFGKQLHYSKVKQVSDKLRSYSAFVNLVVNLSSKKSEQRQEQGDISQAAKVDHLRTYDMLTSCLLEYQKAYGDGFIFVSLMKDNPYKQELSDFCEANGIDYHSNYGIVEARNLIKGSGHLNEKGNRELGLYLADLLYVSGLTGRNTPNY